MNTLESILKNRGIVKKNMPEVRSHISQKAYLSSENLKKLFNGLEELLNNNTIRFAESLWYDYRNDGCGTRSNNTETTVLFVGVYPNNKTKYVSVTVTKEGDVSTYEEWMHNTIYLPSEIDGEVYDEINQLPPLTLTEEGELTISSAPRMKPFSL